MTHPLSLASRIGLASTVTDIDAGLEGRNPQVVMRFENDFGLSIIEVTRPITHYEIAVVRFNSENDADWNFVEDNPVTPEGYGGVMWLNDDELAGVVMIVRNMS